MLFSLWALLSSGVCSRGELSCLFGCRVGVCESTFVREIKIKDF